MYESIKYKYPLKPIEGLDYKIFPYFISFSDNIDIILQIAFSDFNYKDPTIEKNKIFNFGYAIYFYKNNECIFIKNWEESKKYFSNTKRSIIKNVLYSQLKEIMSFINLPIIFRGFLPYKTFDMPRYIEISKIFDESLYKFKKEYFYIDKNSNEVMRYILYSKKEFNYDDYKVAIENRKKIII